MNEIKHELSEASTAGLYKPRAGIRQKKKKASAALDLALSYWQLQQRVGGVNHAVTDTQ